MEQDACPQNPPRDASKASDFGDVVRDHAAMVHATARRVTGNTALADDVTQETFLALARRGHHALESVAAWLRRVAGRKASNAVRAEQRRRRKEEAAAALTPPGAEDVALKDLEPVVHQLLNELPTPWKECLVEHYLEGRTQQEVAHRRGINQSTVSRYLDAGLRELKERLRSKGIACGTALSAFVGAQSAAASSLSPASLSGSIAVSGAHSGTSMSTLSLAVLTMKATHIVVAAALVGIPVFLYHHRAEKPVKPAAAKPAPKMPAVAGFARPGNTKASGAATAPKHYRPEPVTEEVRLKVDALVAHFKNMSAQEKEQDPEFMELNQRFTYLLGLNQNDDEANSRLSKAMTGLMHVKGIDVEKPSPQNANSFGLQMSFYDPDLDSPVGRSWLEAVVSGDHKRVADWIINRIEGAAFEYAFDPNLKTTSEGVRALPLPKKAAVDE